MISSQTKSVPPSSWTMANDSNKCFSTRVRINAYNVIMYSQQQLTYPKTISLHILKQSGFYPWLTSMPETSVGCASKSNPWQLHLWDARWTAQRWPCATGHSLPRSGRNLIAIKKIQLLQRRVAQDLQQVCSPIGTFGVSAEAPGVLKGGLWGYTTPVGRWHIKKNTFMPSKPQSSKNLGFVGG